MHQVRIASVVLPLIVSAIVGCGKKEILIGGLAPLSVEGVDAGIATEHGFEMAFAECNAKGGINGHPVKLLFADDRGDRLTTVNVMRRFITQDKVVAVLGPVWSDTAVSGGKICQQAKMPLIATLASESFGTSGIDPSTLLDRMLPGKPDLLYLAVWGDAAGSLVKQAREKGYTGPILGTDAWDYQELVKIAGPAVEGSYFTNHFSTGESRPEVQDFVKKYVGRFGVEPDSVAVMAYDASRLLFDSISRAGSTRHDAVRDALKTADFPAISGRVKFDGFRNPVKPVVIVQIQSGKFAYNSTMMP
jgi:ABC-type branched-subunit amino acid transport system substrate-binding protein